MARIKFNFEDKSIPSVIVENISDDQSILEVTEEANIHLNHNCGGVCACSTCHIYLQSGENLVEELSEREEDFIDRAKNPRLSSRLSCQCVLQKGNGVLEVIIPDQTLIHGE